MVPEFKQRVRVGEKRVSLQGATWEILLVIKYFVHWLSQHPFLVVILHYSFAVLQVNTTGVNKVKSVQDHSVLFLKIAWWSIISNKQFNLKNNLIFWVRCHLLKTIKLKIFFKHETRINWASSLVLCKKIKNRKAYG